MTWQSVRSRPSDVLDDAELQRLTGDEIEGVGRLDDQRQAKLCAFNVISSVSRLFSLRPFKPSIPQSQGWQH